MSKLNSLSNYDIFLLYSNIKSFGKICKDFMAQRCMGLNIDIFCLLVTHISLWILNYKFLKLIIPLEFYAYMRY